MVKIRLLTKNQRLGLPGSVLKVCVGRVVWCVLDGVDQTTIWSLQNLVEVKLRIMCEYFVRTSVLLTPCTPPICFHLHILFLYFFLLYMNNFLQLFEFFQKSHCMATNSKCLAVKLNPNIDLICRDESFIC